MTLFKRAVATNHFLNMALVGGPGTGKTYTALRLAAHLGERICLIDGERGRGSLYAREFTYDTARLPDFGPRTYLAYLQAAVQAGYDVIIVDGISPEWDGDQGCLQWVDDLQRRGIERARAWAQVTPIHEQVVRALVECPCHLIVTMRARERYAVDKDGEGRSQVVKLGVGPIQQDRMVFEFPIVGVLDSAHQLQFTKSSCHGLDNATLSNPGEDLARVLLDWLDPLPARPRVVSDAEIRAAVGMATRAGRWTMPQVTALMHTIGASAVEDLSDAERRHFLSVLSANSGAAWAGQHAQGNSSSSVQ